MTWLERQSDEYKAYHKNVVDACARIAGEHNREFFDSMSYDEDFAKGHDPREVAETNVDDACR